MSLFLRRNNPSKFLLCVLSLILAMKAVAQDDAAQMLHQNLNLFNTLSGSFEQVIRDADGLELQKSNGIFKLKRPGFLYWGIEPPYKQLVVSNTKLTWVFDPDLEQVTIYSAQSANQGPLQVLAGSLEELKTKYKVSNKEAEKDTFILEPRNEADIEQSFHQLIFSFNDNQLHKISMLDKLKQETEITLSDVDVNPELDDQTFYFDVPEGVDIVENGKF